MLPLGAQVEHLDPLSLLHPSSLHAGTVRDGLLEPEKDLHHDPPAVMQLRLLAIQLLDLIVLPQTSQPLEGLRHQSPVIHMLRVLLGLGSHRFPHPLVQVHSSCLDRPHFEDVVVHLSQVVEPLEANEGGREQLLSPVQPGFPPAVNRLPAIVQLKGMHAVSLESALVEFGAKSVDLPLSNPELSVHLQLLQCAKDRELGCTISQALLHRNLRIRGSSPARERDAGLPPVSLLYCQDKSASKLCLLACRAPEQPQRFLLEQQLLEFQVPSDAFLVLNVEDQGPQSPLHQAGSVATIKRLLQICPLDLALQLSEEAVHNVTPPERTHVLHQPLQPLRPPFLLVDPFLQEPEKAILQVALSEVISFLLADSSALTLDHRQLQ